MSHPAMLSHRTLVSLLALGALGTLAGAASAAPTLRKQLNQHGDFLLVGNTLGYDCANGTPAPVVGTVTGCGTTLNTGDSAPDFYWRADSPGAGQAAANAAVTTANSRSTAVLTIPAGATVSYARLYWGAQAAGPTADTAVTLDGPGASTSAVTADANATIAGPPFYYQSGADVTAFVTANGSGAYRVSGVTSTNFVGANNSTLFAGWYLVVLYQLATDPPRNLTIFDGLDEINGPANTTLTTSLSGFLVPNAGFDAKLGVVAWEGDGSITGDAFQFNGNTLSNASNPANNFFNGTRSWLGAPVSVAGDLPQLTGAAGSMSGVDIDVVDIKAYLTAGQTSATITSSSTGDTYFLGAYVTSISTFQPDFSSTTKSFVDVNGGTVRPGDVIQYTIVATNSGNDAAVNSVLTDALPAGITYVPGSIKITAGPNSGAKTDATADDQAEYVAATRTVTVRLGTGANGTTGGTLAIGASTTVTFSVTVDASASGTINNQAIVTAAGQQGAPPTPYPSDGNGSGAGVPPTPLPIAACVTNADCPAAAPFCLVGTTTASCVQCLDNTACAGATPWCNGSNTCAACAADGAPSCTNAALPACQLSGALAGQCTECSGTNATLCSGAKPVCVTSLGTCGCNVDADCAATDWCDTSAHACTTKLANATPVPNVPGHTPALTGVCAAGVGPAVCATGACDTNDNLCGYANGDGPCSVATQAVCRSGACGTSSNVCIPPGGCAIDADCGAGQWCDAGTCALQLGNGVAIPASAGHTPPIAGACTAQVGAIVCASLVCDTVDNACGFANGDGTCDASSAGVVCRSSVCDPNDHACGFANGDGPCTVPTATSVCRSGACGAVSLLCVPAGGCLLDGDCGANQWCSAGACVPKLGNGTAIPTVAGHNPALTGACDPTVGSAICASAVCDTSDNACGYANGDGPCTAQNGATVCRSGNCGPGGTCTAAPACTVDGDCTASQWCSSGACVPKLGNGTAIPTVAGHNPNLNGTCTQPVGAAVCASAVCDTKDGACGWANGDGTCTASNAATVCRSGICATTGPNAGRCEACDTDSDCPSATPACGAANTCVQCTSKNQTACTGANPSCDTASSTCKPCVADFGATGSLACPTSADPFCATGGTCGKCTANADCTGHAGGPTCDTTSGACTTACASDADCGAVDSGRVCDDTSKLCADGCRGTGGNGCPAGDTCSSTTSAIGTCSAVADAGADADAAADAGSDAKADAPADAVADVGPDAPVESDGSTHQDAAPVDDSGTLEGGGCAVATSKRGSSGGAVAMLGLALAGLAAARRRRGPRR